MLCKLRWWHSGEIGECVGPPILACATSSHIPSLAHSVPHLEVLPSNWFSLESRLECYDFPSMQSIYTSQHDPNAAAKMAFGIVETLCGNKLLDSIHLIVQSINTHTHTKYSDPFTITITSIFIVFNSFSLLRTQQRKWFHTNYTIGENRAKHTAEYAPKQMNTMESVGRCQNTVKMKSDDDAIAWWTAMVTASQ